MGYSTSVGHISCLTTLVVLLASRASCQGLSPVFNESTFLPEQTLRKGLDPTAFLFTFQNATSDVSNSAQTVGGGGYILLNTLSNNPFLGTLPGDGNAQQITQLDACGHISPQLHPRGTEVAYITPGSLEFGYVEENGGANNTRAGKLVSAMNVTVGQAVKIPSGFIHYIVNHACTPARFISNFGNKDPGTVSIWPAITQLPAYVVGVASGVKFQTVQTDITTTDQPANPTLNEACFKACLAANPNLVSTGAAFPDRGNGKNFITNPGHVE